MSNVILIRGLELADWQQVAALFMLPQCQRQTLRLPYQSSDLFRQRVERQIQTGHSLVAIDSNEVVGLAELCPGTGRRLHVSSLMIAVHDAYQGQGIGSRLMAELIDLADNWLNFKRLELDVYCDNAAAIALYKKFGFEIEGTKRKFAFREGEYVDAFNMSRVR